MARSHAHPHVLVVDHDRGARDALAATLESGGYAVRCVENGAQGLVALRQDLKPDAILLDLSMPVMTGWELLDWVRDDGRLRDIPIVVVSTMRAPEGIQHLDKPANAEEILATLDRVCDR